MPRLLIFSFIFIFFSCKEDVLPKPKGYLSLNYPKNSYRNLALKRPYHFKVSNNSNVLNEANNWIKIKYPLLKASIDITYRPVNNNLKELLLEAEKLVFKHTLKADQIIPKDYINPQKKVFASIFDITGNAASQIQFHATDSTHHFLKGAVYFYSKPNYDSVLPAVNYIKKDIIKIIETLSWRD